MQETQEMWLDPWVRKIPWRRGMAAHSSILVWKTPCAEEPGGLQFQRVQFQMGSQRVRHDWADMHVFTHPYVCAHTHTHTHTHTIDAHSLLRAANLRALREVLVAQWLEQSLGGILISPQLSTNTDRITPYWEFVLVRISRFHMNI